MCLKNNIIEILKFLFSNKSKVLAVGTTPAEVAGADGVFPGSKAKTITGTLEQGVTERFDLTTKTHVSEITDTSRQELGSDTESVVGTILQFTENLSVFQKSVTTEN